MASKIPYRYKRWDLYDHPPRDKGYRFERRWYDHPEWLSERASLPLPWFFPRLRLTLRHRLHPKKRPPIAPLARLVIYLAVLVFVFVCLIACMSLVGLLIR